MSRSDLSRRTARLVARALLVSFAAWALSYGVSAAQDSGAAAQVASGPFLITVNTQPAAPRPGPVRFLVAVRSVATGEPIHGARVELVGTDPDGGADWLSPALSFPADPDHYIANAELSRPGVWNIGLSVQGEPGEAQIAFPLRVSGGARSGAGAAGTVVFGLVFLALAAGVWWLWRASRRARRGDVAGRGR